MTDPKSAKRLRTVIVDDEPLAVDRLIALAAKIDALDIVGCAGEGAAALERIASLEPDLLLLDMTMPEMDGLEVARRVSELAGRRPAIIFVTAHERFAVAAFDLEAVDYVLKPVARDRLERAVERVMARSGTARPGGGEWLEELWVPHRSELLRIDMARVDRIDAERDYVRLHVEGATYLLLQTIAGLEEQLDPGQFIRIHRSTILRRDSIRGLRHDGLGVWSVELGAGDRADDTGTSLRIGRTYLPKVKAMAGR